VTLHGLDQLSGVHDFSVSSGLCVTSRIEHPPFSSRPASGMVTVLQERPRRTIVDRVHRPMVIF